MNVLYHFRTRGVGAEGVHIAGIANAFEALGHPVRFVSPGGTDPRAQAGANPFAAKQRGGLAALSAKAPGFLFELLELGYNLHAARALAAAARDFPPELVYERHAFFLGAGARFARRRGVPLVVEVNELVGDERVRAQPLLSGLARRMDRATFRAARLVVVVSPHLARRAAEGGAAPERVLVLPNAVRPEDFAGPGRRAEFRARWGLAEPDVAVGFIGWFVPWHRLDFLLEAFAQAASAEPRLKLVLVGAGTLQEDLRAQAAALGLGGRVLFPGPLAHREIPDALAALDVALVPHSNVFRSPIKLFEYMARGLPAVAPATEPIASVLDEGRTGLLFPPLDAPALAAVLRRLAAEPGLRAALGAAGRARVLAEHTWTRNAEKVLAAVR